LFRVTDIEQAIHIANDTRFGLGASVWTGGAGEHERYVYELTIQDSPLNIWMGSLLWQESLDQPIEALGTHEGFTTNRPA
jgi:hypothetical protein